MSKPSGGGFHPLGAVEHLAGEAVHLAGEPRSLTRRAAIATYHHPGRALRNVTGIDVGRVEHPVRALQQDYHRGEKLAAAYKAGKITRQQFFERSQKSIGIIPFGRFGDAGEKAVAKIPGLGVAKGAAAEAPHPPGLPPSETPQEAIGRSIGTMKKLRGQQKVMYSAELSKRVARANAALEKAGGGIAGEQAALRELRGELPKTTMTDLMNGRINPTQLGEMATHIQHHPDLSFFDKRTLNKSLGKLVTQGVTPTNSEIKLYEKVFGPEVAQSFARSKPGAFLIDAANIPRSLLASLDVSAVMRQGLVAAAGHPIISAKNVPPMFRALVSEPYYQGMINKIEAGPYAAHHEAGGLAITRLVGKTSKLREEQFSSDLAEKLTGGKYSFVRASGRAYTGFLDKTRADIFDSLLKAAEKKGSQRVLVGRREGGGFQFGQKRELDINDPQFLKSLANYVNSATGRGKLPGKHLEGAAPALNAIFFSPRLAYSRINFLDPTWYLRGPEHGGLDAFARRQAVKSILALGSGATAALMLAGHYTRASIGSNPLSADFAKLKFGNTRVDILGGFQQYIRLLAQIQQGKIVSSTTGKTLNLGGGYGQPTRAQIMIRFAEGKFAPIPSLMTDLANGTTFAGAPLSVKQELYSRVIPLVAQDAYDLYKSGHNIPLALAGYGISATGVGIQTYGKKKPKARAPSRPRSNSLLQRAPSSGGSLLRSGGSTSPSLLRR